MPSSKTWAPTRLRGGGLEMEVGGRGCASSDVLEEESEWREQGPREVSGVRSGLGQRPSQYCLSIKAGQGCWGM